MKAIRKFIYSILGLHGYLRLVSKVYLCMINVGMLKSKYPELFFLKKIIRQGDTCLDIVANVGYYSHFLCKYVGIQGKVYAVEPISDFSTIMMKNIPKKYRKNFVLYPYALGGEEKKIEMGLPIVDGIIHHGMTHIMNQQEQQAVAKIFEVEMKVPDKLFSEISKLDFVKCDVEGYEYFVFSNMQDTFSKHKPIVQCELGGNYKNDTLNLMKSLGFFVYVLENHYLKLLQEEQILQYANDVYFVHEEKVESAKSRGFLK